MIPDGYPTGITGQKALHDAISNNGIPRSFHFLKCPCEFLCLVTGPAKYTRIFCPYFLTWLARRLFHLMPFMKLFIVYYYHLPPHKEIILYVFFKVLNIKISPYVAN